MKRGARPMGRVPRSASRWGSRGGAATRTGAALVPLDRTIAPLWTDSTGPSAPISTSHAAEVLHLLGAAHVEGAVAPMTVHRTILGLMGSPSNATVAGLLAQLLPELPGLSALSFLVSSLAIELASSTRDAVVEIATGLRHARALPPGHVTRLVDSRPSRAALLEAIDELLDLAGGLDLYVARLDVLRDRVVHAPDPAGARLIPSPLSSWPRPVWSPRRARIPYGAGRNRPRTSRSRCAS